MRASQHEIARVRRTHVAVVAVHRGVRAARRRVARVRGAGRVVVASHGRAHALTARAGVGGAGTTVVAGDEIVVLPIGLAVAVVVLAVAHLRRTRVDGRVGIGTVAELEGSVH
ncbi:MAG: hypothetical protein A2821_02790 [Candidatus Magasanikbacteria bacterium RIFCSPHIGHO2_01_FULL_41_23]|nr:MAG: hypothetical protein A2821_02790 [Candidatus Magasanikbacteria bacterium RIFCSPHIGHO2_01_FULL_41_23]OGH67264.1 MAG: hypothetical protein A3C66_00805 [Candidatus Magasanikbacteria bacterium RIFCSPHIGHO2_02_FULL_41_35]OGH76489.1 MAG: hypothetical protein A3F22_00015 [Candidatus Magasanikbacteria bacterium RIFCSPHIGHO2_12_FULL_41_16]